MKDYKVLKFLDLFKGLFEKMDIDYEAMRRILGVKLLLDGRRVSTVMGNSNKKSTDDKNNFMKSLGMYLLIGLVLIPLTIFGDSFLFQMTFVFGIIMFMLMTSLISDFSSVLLDIRDKEILLSKPINSRTLNMAKLIHIFMYIFMTTMAISAPALISSFFKHGIRFFLIFLGEIILMDLFIIVVTAFIYLAILTFFDGEKLKDIINYVQIGLTIVITVGYQLVARVFQFIDLDKIRFEPTWWKYLLPPIWFAAPFELFIKNNKEIYLLIYSILALVIPIISIIIYIKLIPAFERNLQKLSSAGEKLRNRNKMINLIAKLVCKDKEERNFYKFATYMMRNERTFKLKVYPQLGFSIVFPLIMLLSISQGMGMEEVRNSNSYFFIYFSAIMIPILVSFLRFSGNYKGAWIYKTMAIKDTKSIYRGTLKAAFINLVTPVFALVAIIFIYIYKWEIIYDVFIAYFSMMLYIRIAFIFTDKDIPFSRAFEVSEGSQDFIKTMITIAALALIAAVHFLVSKVPNGIYIYLPIIIIANIIAWNMGFDNIGIELK